MASVPLFIFAPLVPAAAPVAAVRVPEKVPSRHTPVRTRSPARRKTVVHTQVIPQERSSKLSDRLPCVLVFLVLDVWHRRPG